MYNIKLYNTKIVRVYFSMISKICLFLDPLNLKAGKNHGEQGNPGESLRPVRKNRDQLL